MSATLEVNRDDEYHPPSSCPSSQSLENRNTNTNNSDIGGAVVGVNTNNNDDKESGEKDKYPLDPRRWVALFCLCTVGGISSAQQMNFASVTKAAKAQFGLDDEALDWLVAVFYLSFILLSFFALSLFERFGLRVVLLLASLCNTFGALLKLVVIKWYPGYYALIITQAICALAQPLYMPLAPALAAAWFPDDQRAIATSVASLCTAMGTAFGMGYAPFIVTGDGSVDLFLKYLSIQACFATVETIINILFVKEEPEFAPSAAAELRRKEASKHHHTTILQRMRQMVSEICSHFGQRNKALLLIGGGIFVGTLYAVPGAMCQIFEPWGISNNSCGLISGAIIIVGLVEGVIAGLYVDNTKKYKFTLLTSCCIGVVGMITAGVAIVLHAPVIVIGVLIVVGGAPLLAAFGVILDAAAEETFPLDEVFSSSAIVYVGCSMAFIEMNAVPPMLTSGENKKLMSILVWCIFLVCMIIGTICLFIWKPETPRMKFEAKKNKERNGGSGEEQEETTNENNNERTPLLE